MSSTKNHTAALRESDYRLKPGSGLANAWKISLGVGIAGLAGAGYGYTLDPDHKRFAFSYLFAFFTFLTIALGALFFVLIQYLTRAGWSVTVRRTAEFFMSGLLVFAILVFPLFLTMKPLFHQWLDQKPDAAFEAAAYPPESHAAHKGEHAAPSEGKQGAHDEHGAADETDGTKALVDELKERREQALEEYEAKEKTRILQEKAPYLNNTFFHIRTGFYLVVWIALAWRYFSWSTEQDSSKRAENTRSAQRFAPIGLMLFALTITFAAFDWLMGLDPFWYSTIFGVYIFAGSSVVNMAVLVVTTLMLQRSGALGKAVNTEHFHDMGKLMFGWLVFWAYISFSQFFLIWYGNIPEEIVFFHRRWGGNDGSWKMVSLSLLAIHFIIPFWLLMSRNVKRRVQVLALGAAVLIVMHVVEMYWIVMPNYGAFQPHWLDLACLLGVGGIYLSMVLRSMAGHALIPVGDPRLVRALKFENA